METKHTSRIMKIVRNPKRESIVEEMLVITERSMSKNAKKNEPELRRRIRFFPPYSMRIATNER